MDLFDYENCHEWCLWLNTVLDERLEGSGLRAEVVYIPNKEYYNEIGSIVRVKESFSLTVTQPLNWEISKYYDKEGLTLDIAIDIVDKALEFKTVAWDNKIENAYQYSLFKRLPGRFTFLAFNSPQIIRRLTYHILEEHFSARHIKRIDTMDSHLIIRTRYGVWRVNYWNYRVRMDEVIGFMKAFMRKPLRYQYLRELRRNRHDKKQD